MKLSLLTIISAAFLLSGPALANDTSTPPQLTQQDVKDAALALSLVGSHCGPTMQAACQAGADAQIVLTKIEGLYEAQQKADDAVKGKHEH